MITDIKHKTLSSVIAERLRQEILNGSHPSGGQLRQDALATAFGVSRIPVREALFQLEAQGLVQIVPHKGAIVTLLSPEEINDVFDLRLMLEPRLLRESIAGLTATDFARMDDIQKKFSAAIRAKDLSQWGTLNAELHTVFYSRALLPQTAMIVAGLLHKSDRYTRVQLSTSAAMKRAETEHAELIALCKAHKTRLACDLLTKHIETVRKDLLRLLKFAPDDS